MSDISLSKAVRSNLLSLQNTATMMSKTQERLSTGNKVNSALDNPTNFFTSSSLNARAGDLNSLMDSMANGIQTLEAADNGLSSITKTLESMQATLRQARQDKSFETASYSLSHLDPNDGATHQLAFSGGAFDGTTNFPLTTTGKGQTATASAPYTVPASTSASYTGAANLTTAGNTAGTLNITYGGTTVSINVGANAASATSAADLRTDITNKLVGTALEGKVTLSGTTGATLTAVGTEDAAITVSGTAATSVFGAAAAAVRGSNGKLDFTVNGTAISLDSTTGATLADAVVNANNALKAGDSKFQAYANGTSLAFRAITTDAGALSIGGSDGPLFGAPSENPSLNLALTVDEMVARVNNSTDFKGQIKASNDNGRLRFQNLSTRELNIGGTNDTNQIIGTATASTSIKGNSMRSDLAAQFNELRDQLDKLSDDASFNGINLLRGDKLTITFNETGTSSIDIQTKDEQALDSTRLNLQNIIPQDLDADSDIDSRLATVKSALAHVRSQASTFGQNLSIVENRQNFTKEMINTLQTGAANLTLADMNEEAANLLALQTRQSLSSSSLSLASQADQSVLQLLQ